MNGEITYNQALKALEPPKNGGQMLIFAAHGKLYAVVFEYTTVVGDAPYKYVLKPTSVIHGYTIGNHADRENQVYGWIKTVDVTEINKLASEYPLCYAVEHNTLKVYKMYKANSAEIIQPLGEEVVYECAIDLKYALDLSAFKFPKPQPLSNGIRASTISEVVKDQAAAAIATLDDPDDLVWIGFVSRGGKLNLVSFAKSFGHATEFNIEYEKGSVIFHGHNAINLIARMSGKHVCIAKHFGNTLFSVLATEDEILIQDTNARVRRSDSGISVEKPVGSKYIEGFFDIVYTKAVLGIPIDPTNAVRDDVELTFSANTCSAKLSHEIKNWVEFANDELVDHLALNDTKRSARAKVKRWVKQGELLHYLWLGGESAIMSRSEPSGVALSTPIGDFSDLFSTEFTVDSSELIPFNAQIILAALKPFSGCVVRVSLHKVMTSYASYARKKDGVETEWQQESLKHALGITLIENNGDPILNQYAVVMPMYNVERPKNL